MNAPQSGGRPFRRIALVLSGGGALGAYEVGVLKVLEQARLVPHVIAGVSIGAINAVAWLAHGMRTAPLEAEWLRLNPSSLGVRWITLALRSTGGALVLFAAIQLVLAVLGSRALSGPHWLRGYSSGRLDAESALLDLTAWLVLGVAGFAMAMLSRRAEAWIVAATPRTDPRRFHRRFGVVLLVLALFYGTVWVLGWPWPHRFSATLLMFAGTVWLANHPGRAGAMLRTLLRSLMPEMGGRGLWSEAARRAVLEHIVSQGDVSRVAANEPRLIMSALAVDSGRICHFMTGPDPGPEFRARIERELGEVALLHDPEDVMRAAMASSAVPGVFEPVRIAGRDFVDAGGFSNQPLHVALADGADAAIVVLLSPRDAADAHHDTDNLFRLGARLLEVANWRDMQAELHSLPDAWTQETVPSRLCVVEPQAALAGGVLDFGHTRDAIARGEADAREALIRAGWWTP